MNYADKIIEHIELHSVAGIRECFENGVDPNMLFRNQPLIYELTSEYTRSVRFKDCVKTFIEFGLDFPDKSLLAVLTGDADTLDMLLTNDAAMLQKRYTMRCAYTPMHEVSLLHICAEFNHVDCARILVKHGADINAKAGVDENGFGAQTSIFHTVNQNQNQSAEMLHYLLLLHADLQATVKGLIWGKGYPWETVIPAVNPVSYAIMGLLPQMHRNETVVAKTISLLLKEAYGINYAPQNIPNAYLRQ